MEKATRRTQVERREAGRRALIESTIACLSEKGFGATTFQDIVKRANCTTGAIQHHFGSKNGLYIAVLDDLLEEFQGGLEDFPDPGQSLERRCDKTIATLETLYTSERYGAIHSLILGAQHDPELRDLVASQRRNALAITRNAWLRVFAGTGCPDEKLLSLFEIIVAVLRDFHSNKTLGVDEARARLGFNIVQLKRMALLELQARR